jgi:hypothetical protein
MRRLLLGLVLLAAGFGSGLGLALMTRAQTHTRTVEATTTRVEVVNGSRTAQRIPAAIPTLVEGSTDPHGLVVSSAVPIDATLDSADYVGRKPRQLIVTWEREHLTRDGQAAIWQRRGLAIWQLDRGNAAAWHRVYTYETLLNKVVGVEGFRVSLGDVSGDGRPEVLVFFDTDGSAGGGTYHLFANAGYRLRQALVKELSSDQGTISFAPNALLIREGVDYRGPGIHCCYRRVRVTWLRWNGRSLIRMRQTVRKNRRGWPPG